MNKLGKIFAFLVLLPFFSGCGYTPIFSKKDVNFTFESIEFLGDKEVEEKISRLLTIYKNRPDKENKVELVIKNQKSIVIASKNSKGEPLTNRINIDSNVKIILADNSIVEKNFSKSTVYSIIDRKSEQESIENKLIENLSSEIATQIIFEILKNTK